MTLPAGSSRVLLLTALLLTMGAGLLYSRYAAQKDRIAGMSDRLEQLERRNREARSVRATEVELDLERYRARVARLEELIPARREVPELLESMAAEARRAGLGDLASMRPGAVESGGFYTRGSYEVSVVGRYHAVGRFLAGIASLPRIVTPVELEMTVASAYESEDASDVSVRLTVETYVLPEEGPAGPSSPEEEPWSGEG